MSDTERKREHIDVEEATTMWQNGFAVFVNSTQLPAYDRNNYDNNLVTYDVIRDAHDGDGKSWCTAYKDDILQENDIDRLSDALNTVIAVLEHNESEYRIDEYAREANEYMPFKWNDGETTYQNIEAALAEGNVQFIQSYINDIVDDSATASLFIGSTIEYAIPQFNHIEHLKNVLDEYAVKYGKEPPEFFRVNIGEVDTYELSMLNKRFQEGGYNVLWEKDHNAFVTTIDDMDYVGAVLDERGFEYGYDIVSKTDFAHLIEENSLISSVPLHEIPKDLAVALWERDINIYANGVRSDIYAFTTDEQADKMWNKLWSQDISLSVNENDYGRVNLANAIALAVTDISTAAKNMEDALPVYAAHANEENPFDYNKELSCYRNILNACLDKNVYFIQEWLDDVIKNNPSLPRISDYENTGIASISKLRGDIKEYIDEYIFDDEPMSNDITIKCELSETLAFDEGKTYTVAEFDKIMSDAEQTKQATRAELIDKYGSEDAVRDALNKLREESLFGSGKGKAEYQKIAAAMMYDKVKFTIQFPDGQNITERQDIGDGHNGVIEFMKSFGDTYKNTVEQLEKQETADAMDVIIKQQREEFYTPHIYVHNTEEENNRYELCPKYPDDAILGSKGGFDSPEEARQLGLKYLQNYLDPHSLAPSEKEIEGYAILDTKMNRLIEVCGVTSEELSKNFSLNVMRNSLAAEAMEKGKNIRSEKA